MAAQTGGTRRLRHFEYLSSAQRRAVFHRPPVPFAAGGPQVQLAQALGATLYTPATLPTLAKKLTALAANEGLVASVVCLEDAVPDAEVAAAEANLVEQLQELAADPPPLPLLFVRPRSQRQLRRLAGRLGLALDLVSGFVLPKFRTADGAGWLDAVAEVAAGAGGRLYAMPILEGPEVLYRECRARELEGLGRLFAEHQDRVLAVRIGATDLCGLLGLRRGADESIYDLAPIRDCIADVVNAFGRDGVALTVAGSVWEYYSRSQRIWKPQLRQSLFAEHAPFLRERLIGRHLDGLIQEVLLDKANGLVGKSVIHPSHVRAVNALLVVTHEEYLDAEAVLGGADGATASRYGNKMNESKPHRAWAERVMRRVSAFGVLAERASFVDLLDG